MVSFLPGELTPEDITRIAVFNKVLRTARNPFGRHAYRSRYGGKASPWKFLRKGNNESTDEYLERLSKVNPGVSKGLGESIKVSTDPKYSKLLGVSHVIYKDGTMGIIPTRSAIMGRDSTNGKIAMVRRYPDARAAMMQIVQPPAETKRSPKSKQTELPDYLKKTYFQSQL